MIKSILNCYYDLKNIFINLNWVFPIQINLKILLHSSESCKVAVSQVKFKTRQNSHLNTMIYLTRLASSTSIKVYLNIAKIIEADRDHFMGTNSNT